MVGLCHRIILPLRQMNWVGVFLHFKLMFCGDVQLSLDELFDKGG